MRCSLRDCLICRCPPSSLTYGKNWSQDATNQTHNSSRHRIIDYGVGLLAGLVETRIPPLVDGVFVSFCNKSNEH